MFDGLPINILIRLHLFGTRVIKKDGNVSPEKTLSHCESNEWLQLLTGALDSCFGLVTQRPRTDLNKKSLPRPKTTTA